MIRYFFAVREQSVDGKWTLVDYVENREEPAHNDHEYAST